MQLWEMTALGVGLAMDATAVSMTNGMSVKNIKKKEAFLIASAFGIFQGIMPFIGYFTGALLSEYISRIDHWIALFLLGYIGGKMIFEAASKNNDTIAVCRFSFRMLLIQAISTSIDALAVGVSLAALQAPIIKSCTVIATTTFFLSFIAIYIGRRFGDLLGQKAQIVGGILLIGIGLKIFIQHFFA